MSPSQLGLSVELVLIVVLKVALVPVTLTATKAVVAQPDCHFTCLKQTPTFASHFEIGKACSSSFVISILLIVMLLLIFTLATVKPVAAFQFVIYSINLVN